MRKRFALLAAVITVAAAAAAYAAGGTLSENAHSEHSYRVTALKNGAVFFCCSECGKAETAMFSDWLGSAEALPDAVSDGTVNAKDYAALLKGGAYYSGFENAVADARQLTDENADTNEKNAVAQLYIEGDTAYLTLFEDVSGCSDIALTANTVLNLNGKTLTFSAGSGLTFSADVCVENGTLSAVNRSVIEAQNDGEAHRAVFRSLTLSETVTPDLSAECRILSLKAENAVLEDVRICAEGSGNSSYNLYGIYTEPQVNATLTDTEIMLNCNGLGRLQGTEFGGTSTITGLRATVESDDTGTWGVRTLQGSKTVLNAAEIYAATANADHGLGMVLNGRATVNSTEALPVTCFGKRQGLSTSPYEKTTVNGGIYSSCEHIVYVTGNADFYDCVFVNENRSLYSGLDSAYCVYFGLDRCPENAVCNFYSCRFGSEHYTDNLYGTALVATNNYGYRAPRDVHLYDCAVYGGTSSFFSYNYPSASNLADTRFYLHGSTRLYERGATNSEVTKETLAASVASWKTKARYNNTTGKYSRQLIGDKNILGTCAAVNEDTGEIEALYLTDDANVYDYR